MTNDRTMPDITVFPVLVYENVSEACEWLCRVFGFSERWRAGNHRALLGLERGAVMLGEARTGAAGEPGEGMEFVPGMSNRLSHSVMVRVADADQHFERARDCGAQILESPRDFPYGERQYTAVDLGGHHWTFSQSLDEVPPEKWGGRSAS
jgi:uncharacterized glyoxalase superfamily protein PhnB